MSEVHPKEGVQSMDVLQTHGAAWGQEWMWLWVQMAPLFQLDTLGDVGLGGIQGSGGSRSRCQPIGNGRICGRRAEVRGPEVPELGANAGRGRH